MTDLDRHLRDALRAHADAATPAPGLPEAALRAGRRARRLRTGLAAAASVVLLGLLALPLTVRPTTTGVPAAPPAAPHSATATPSATPPAPTDQPTPTSGPLPSLSQDTDLAHVTGLVAFARDPENTPIAGIGLADRVLLGVGSELFEQVPVNKLATPAGWDTGDEATLYERSGPFNAITTLRDFLARTPDAALESTTRVDYPSCNNPDVRVAAPPSLVDRRRVTVQPASGAVDSCIDWFAVDLYINDADQVVAVVLVLGSP